MRPLRRTAGHRTTVRARLRTLLAALATAVVAPLALAATPAVAAPTATAAAEEETSGVIRGGDVLYSASGHRCRLAFNVRRGGEPYGVMPGHCGGAGTSWAAGPDGPPIGVTSVSYFPGRNYALIHFTNPDYEYPGEINLGNGATQRITGASQPQVGQTLCHVTLTAGLQCGSVLSVNDTVHFPEGTIHGLFRGNLCSQPGDTGGPAFSGDTAVGFIVAGSGPCATGGVTYYYPLVPVLQEQGLTLP